MQVIYAIPGLGTTGDLFKNIYVRHHRIHVLQWPELKNKKSLAAYAQDFITQIDTTEPVRLMGVSYGGMLCSEIADKVNAEKTVLISSCKHRHELPFLLRFQKNIPLHQFLSEKIYRSMITRLSWLLGFKKTYAPQLKKMAATLPYGHFKKAIHTIINWDKDASHSSVYHIHGDSDRLLPLSCVKADAIIHKGNHAMIIYKAEEINVILNKVFNGL